MPGVGAVFPRAVGNCNAGTGTCVHYLAGTCAAPQGHVQHRNRTAFRFPAAGVPRHAPALAAVAAAGWTAGMGTCCPGKRAATLISPPFSLWRRRALPAGRQAGDLCTSGPLSDHLNAETPVRGAGPLRPNYGAVQAQQRPNMGHSCGHCRRPAAALPGLLYVEVRDGSGHGAEGDLPLEVHCSKYPSPPPLSGCRSDLTSTQQAAVRNAGDAASHSSAGGASHYAGGRAGRRRRRRRPAAAAQVKGCQQSPSSASITRVFLHECCRGAVARDAAHTIPQQRGL